MVAFPTILSAFAAIFLASLQVLANPTPGMPGMIHTLLTRQISPLNASDIPAQCEAKCGNLLTTLGSCSTVSCYCKDSNVDVIDACFDCAAALPNTTLDTTKAQAILDKLVSSCKEAGFPIKSAKVNSAISIMGSGALLMSTLGVVFALI